MPTSRMTKRLARFAAPTPGGKTTAPELPPLGNDPQSLQADTHRHLGITFGRDVHHVNDYYRYLAVVQTVRDRLMEKWKATNATYLTNKVRRGYYLSMEFLMGRALGNAALNLDLEPSLREAVSELGMDWEELVEQEADAGLGNGGLGRLAACFLDSCATLQLPVTGYGIRYDYGMFRQRIVHGYQHEEPDHWLAHGVPWELERPEFAQRVHFGGHSEFYNDEHGASRVRWVDTQDVLAIPYDVPIPGYRNGTVNTLRLWRATATEEFNLDEFNQGDYVGAVASKHQAENISQVLYPNDKSENGKELRLKQQYFLASASLHDIMRRYTTAHGTDFSHFAELNVLQLNDTHPTVAVPELMRLLLDVYHLGWDESWAIVSSCMAYTNHTLLPEALEKWPVDLFRRLLPRVLEIILEINARFMRQIAFKWPGDTARQSRMSIIEDGPHAQVRMAWLAIVGSFSVNGVAELHSDLLTKTLLKEFYALTPKKFNNKTNGVTQRRWMALCNPGLSDLVDESIGDAWRTDLGKLAELKPLADDSAFRERFDTVKRNNKVELARIVKQECGVDFDPDACFDIQVKRIHEYKRQLLNALHVIHLYSRLKRGDVANWTNRCVLFGGKAAPGYAMAKQIIKFIGNVADVVNNDPDIDGRLKVAYIPNYRVSLMERICPAADLSEQISTAGKEASGTGNMKFMMNGALTIGTLDGANIEIREEVGDDHFFLFGLTTDEITKMRPTYDPRAVIEGNADLSNVMDLLSSGHFNQIEPGIFGDIIRSLTDWGDYWLTCADFPSYVASQSQAAEAFRDRKRWVRSAVLNTASSGKFSTDRTIGDYNRDIWKLKPIVPGSR